MWECKHCNNNFEFTRNTEKANHSRHCKHNIGRIESYKNIKVAKKNFFAHKLGEFKSFEVICTRCNSTFVVAEREFQHPVKQKYFCSRKCANSTGGKAKAKKYHTDDVAHYVTVAWRHHEKKCIVCKEEKIVAVHHYNEDHDDNNPKNLVPLCPTHHQYIHSKFKIEIIDIVDSYIKNKWG